MADDQKEILRSIGNLDPRTGYTARVRAFNRSGIASDWSEAISFNTGDIDIPGAIPTVYLAAGARMILAQWSAVTDVTFDHYEIYVSTTPNFTPDSNHLVASPKSGTIYSITKYWNGAALVDLLTAKAYYIQMYWVTAGAVKTLMGTEVSATTGITNNEDGIQSSLIVADRIATGTLLASYTLSGTIKTGDTGARMELDSGGFRGYAIDGVTKTIEYKTSDGSLTVVGSISGGTIDIGGADSTSFHVDAAGNMWMGNAVFAGAPFSVTSTGSMVVSNATFTGGSVSGSSVSGGTIAGSGVSGTTVSGTNTVANSSGNTLQSGNFVAGTSGWVIKGNGDVEFNAGTFRGSISGASIDIGGADSTSMHVDTSGNMWLGNATFSGAPFTVSSTGALTATNGTFTGTLTGSINNSSGTISGGTITGALIETSSSSLPRIVMKNTTDSWINSVYELQFYSFRSDLAPAKIFCDANTGIGTQETHLNIVSSMYNSNSASGATLTLSSNSSGILSIGTNCSFTVGGSGTFNCGSISSTSISSGAAAFSGSVSGSSFSTIGTITATNVDASNNIDANSFSINLSAVINSSRQFVGSGGVSTAGSITGASYLVAGSSAINSFVQFVGVGGVNTSGSISTSSSGSFGAGISVSGGTAFLNSSCSISGVLSTSSSATSATLFVTGMPTLSAFTIGLASGNQIAVQSSSEKIKRDIASLTNEHNTSNLYQLEARSFNMKGADRIRPDDADKWVGLVVEEVERIDPTLVMIDKEHDYADIDWRALSTYMLVEMQKMRKEIDTINKSK